MDNLGRRWPQSTDGRQSEQDAARQARLAGRSDGALDYRKMYDRVSAMAKIGVWECDLADDELTWTDEIYDLFEVPRGARPVRSEALLCYDPASRAQMERLRAEAIRQGTGFTLDARIRTGSGKERWIRLTAEVEQENGRPARIFGTKQDISEEKAALEKVQALQDELTHLSRISAMSAMASTLAHEINQPLAAISNYMAAASRIVAREALSPELGQCLSEAGESAQRAGEIIRRVRLMIGKGPATDMRVNVAELCADAIALAMSGRSDVSVACTIDATLEAVADGVQVRQVLVNLIQNAFEASPGKPCNVEIEGSRTLTHAQIRVSDDGPGIPQDILARMFESFVTSKPDGLGMGLSICRTIVEAHGGRIWAANRPGGGASVFLTLPSAPVRDAAAGTENGRATRSQLSVK